jgi:TetR/AcrR family transcriptional regulator, cholesterol catabolism regulator
MTSGKKKNMETFEVKKVSIVLRLLNRMETKEKILLKANDLYMRYGIRSVTMDEIALQSGVSKKTIYQFYKDKDELVEAVVNEKIKYTEQCCDGDVSKSINAVEEIFKTIDMLEEVFKNMNPSVMFDLKKYHNNAFIKLEKHKSEYVYNMVKDNLERGIAEGLYRQDINLEILARYRVESMMLPFNPEFYFKTKNSLVDVETEILLHYLHGITNPKGYKLILKYQHERIKKLTSDAKK